MNTTINTLAKQYENIKMLLYNALISEIESIARNILKTEIADEFIIGMGIVMFCKDDEILHDYENKEIQDILDKYDNELGISGYAMRFKKDKPIVYNW